MVSNRVENPSDEAIAAWARVVRVSQSLMTSVEADLKAAGHPPLSWYDALLELKRAGPAGLRPFQLQKKMLLAQYNLSRLVERLVKNGYITRVPSEEDRRGQVLKITRTGRAVLRRMWPAYQKVIQTHFAEELDNKDLRELSRILGKISR